MLAVVVGLAGGITRDLLIGVPPATIRDWRCLAVAGAAGLVTLLAHPLLSRIGGPIDVLDAAGLALFCVTGASTAPDHGLGPAPAVILGAITGIGGGVLLDILVRQGRYAQAPTLPTIPGIEVAGEVDGRRVIGLARHGGGGYAELAAIDETWLVPLPDGSFSLGPPEATAERLRFLDTNGGRALRMNVSSVVYYRTYMP